MKSRKTRRIRLPSIKSIRQGTASFFKGARAVGKKAARSLRRLTRRVTCRKR